MASTLTLTGPTGTSFTGADGPPEPGPSINVQIPASCVISGVTTSVKLRGVTSTGASRPFGGTSPLLVLSDPLAVVSLIQGVAIPGAQIGSSCSSLTFSDSAALPFSSAVAPYDGTFKPGTPLGVLNGSGPALANGVWELVLTNLQGPAIIDCWILSITLSPAP